MTFSTAQGTILSNFNFNFLHPYEKNTTPTLDALLSSTHGSDKDAPYTRFASKFNFDFPKETFVYGLGEKLKSVDGFGLKRFGPSFEENKVQEYEFWNCDAYGHTKSSDPLYHTIPFALFCPNAQKDENFFGFFFDNLGYQKWRFENQQKSANSEIITEFEPLRFFVFAEKFVIFFIPFFFEICDSNKEFLFFQKPTKGCSTIFENNRSSSNHSTNVRSWIPTMQVSCLFLFFFFQIFEKKQQIFPDGVISQKLKSKKSQQR